MGYNIDNILHLMTFRCSY